MHSAIRTQEINPARADGLFRKQFDLCRVNAGQTVAVVSDLGTRREYIQAAFAAAEEMGFDIYEMCVNAIPGWTSVGVPTIGKCKGTLEALCAADMILIFHVPLFSKWLREVQGKGVRVQMVHRRARRSLPAPVAARPEGGDPACAVALPADEGGSRHERRRHRPHLPLRRISGDEPVRHGRRAGPLRSLGRRPAAHLPERRQRATARSCSQPGDIVILPYCRYVVDPVRLEIREGHIASIEGGVDAALMRDWLAEGKTGARTTATPTPCRTSAGD